MWISDSDKSLLALKSPAPDIDQAGWWAGTLIVI